MDYGVNVVSAEAVGDVFCRRDVTLVEGEVRAAIEHFGVVQAGAIVELVKGDEVVMVLIGDGKSSDDPRASVKSSSAFAISPPPASLFVSFCTKQGGKDGDGDSR